MQGNRQRRNIAEGDRLILRRAITGLCLSVLASCDVVVVGAMNLIETTEFSVAGDRLIMYGEINAKTLAQFEDVIAANPGIRILEEQNVPGSLDDDTMIELAYRVRELGLHTHIGRDAEIHSGGVDLFLAGVERTMARGAVIGVHSWSDGTREAADYPRDAPEHEQNRKYIEDMLGDDRFYWFTIYAAPADDIKIMTEQEIQEFGLLTQPIQ